MKISFISTIYNEGATIDNFLDSILKQTKLPYEVIIVDGGSTDDTIARIKNYELRIKDKRTKIRLFLKKGNRAAGRNEAISKANGDLIVCSDAGNILDKDWVKNITEPFKDKTVDVVAGFYKGVGKTIFQKCVIPYALVMPDKVDPKNFLPATRSIAFQKNIWEKVGGFNEKLTHNEDFVFAKALKKAGAKIVFKKDALVYWQPRNTFNQAFIMMYRFAYGDAEARIIRPKVFFIFFRYVIFLFIFLFAIYLRSLLLLIILFGLILVYLLWAVQKNYKYIKQWQAIYLLPLLQVVADWAVLKGTVFGMLGRRISYN